MKYFLITLSLFFLIKYAEAAKIDNSIHALTVAELQEREELIKETYKKSSMIKQVEYDQCVKDEGKDANCENDVFGDLYN